MKRSLFFWQFIGFTFVCVLGTILHFLYDWTNLKVLSFISAVNESTWEHMKIIFFPSLIFAVFQYFFFSSEYKNYWCIKFLGILISLLSIPIIFYTTIGIFGSSPAWFNILSFFLSSGISFFIETMLFKSGRPECKIHAIPIILLLLILISFIVFTIFPLNIPLFIDPRTV